MSAWFLSITLRDVDSASPTRIWRTNFASLTRTQQLGDLSRIQLGSQQVQLLWTLTSLFYRFLPLAVLASRISRWTALEPGIGLGVFATSLAFPGRMAMATSTGRKLLRSWRPWEKSWTTRLGEVPILLRHRSDVWGFQQCPTVQQCWIFLVVLNQY